MSPYLTLDSQEKLWTKAIMIKNLCFWVWFCLKCQMSFYCYLCKKHMALFYALNRITSYSFKVHQNSAITYSPLCSSDPDILRKKYFEKLLISFVSI